MKQIKLGTITNFKRGTISIILLSLLLSIFIWKKYYDYYLNNCSITDKECVYKNIISWSEDSMALTDNFEEKFIRDYGYMKDYLYKKLYNEGDKYRYRNLFYFNEILDSTNLKKYIENCLDTEKKPDKLYYCITRYPIINKDKEEVLKKIEKFKDSKNTGGNEGYNVVIHGYARNIY